jgi:hypothetical protein
VVAKFSILTTGILLQCSRQKRELRELSLCVNRLDDGSRPLVETGRVKRYSRREAALGASLRAVSYTLSPRERLGRHREVHDQEPEVGPVSEWVEGRFGPVIVRIAKPHRDCLAQHDHRRLALFDPLRGGHP